MVTDGEASKVSYKPNHGIKFKLDSMDVSSETVDGFTPLCSPKITDRAIR